MNKSLQIIQHKINAIQTGMLRFKEKDDQVSLQVKATAGSEYCFECITEEDVRGLRNKQVRLVQKHKDDYIYVTGKVDTVIKNKKTIISIVILKACWFVRRCEGATTWLQEQQVYEKNPVSLRMAS